MDLNWLRDFEALAGLGNFSRASEARHVTQPAFSRRIQALEEWAGTALFDRASQPVVPTEAGRRLRPLLADIVRRVEAAREEANTVATGSLRFAATHALSFSFFPGWLRGPEPNLPPVAIHLMSDGLEGCERSMLAGRADFLLCHHHDAIPSRLPPQRFESRPIGTDKLRLVEGGKAKGRRSDALLGYGEGSGLARIVAALRPSPVPPTFTSHLAATLRTMVRDGRGRAWLPDSLVSDDLQDGAIAKVAGAKSIPLEIRLFRPVGAGNRTAALFWSSLPDAATSR